MKQRKALFILVICIAVAAAVAASLGVCSTGGPGTHTHTSIRGTEVSIWGTGLYRHMSAEVAPQGIAQDYVTLFLAVPLLLLALMYARRSSFKGRLLLAGTLGYFLVTYLFYLVMAMYNALFLLYAGLAGASFFALLIALRSIYAGQFTASFRRSAPVKFLGGFLMFNAISIALLWLSIIVPPLLDGTVVPAQAEHYTTLVVQGLDLSLLLPAAFISGLTMARGARTGYLMGTTYLVFLSLLMTALTAKIIAMAWLGHNLFPAVYIIPAFNITSIACTGVAFRHIETTEAYDPTKKHVQA